MKSWTILIILFANICSIWLPHLQAQSLSETIQIAENLQAVADFEGAIRMYKRAIFFDESYQYGLTANLELATCYASLGKMKAALKSLNLAYYQAKDRSKRVDIQLEQVKIHLLQQDYLQAQEGLLLIEYEIDSVHAPQFYLYNGVAWFGLARYDSARIFFHKFIGQSNESLHAQIEHLFSKTNRIERLKPGKARLLSSLIPGLGQLYAGDVKNSLNSFLLTSGLIVLGIHLALVTTGFDAIITVGPWYVRYYQGGRKKAGEITQEKKQQKHSRLYHEILDILERAQKKN